VARMKGVLIFLSGFIVSLVVAYVCADMAYMHLLEPVGTVTQKFVYQSYLSQLGVTLFIIVALMSTVIHQKLKLRVSTVRQFCLGTLPVYALLAVAYYQPSVQQYIAWADAQEPFLGIPLVLSFVMILSHTLVCLRTAYDATFDSYHPDDIKREKERAKEWQAERASETSS
jgi:hypothetical protein